MQQVKHSENDYFTDIIEKIRHLTSSQQKLIVGMLSHREKASKTSKKKLLQRSFGIWADKDIQDSSEYVNRMRDTWSARLGRIKG